MSFKNCVALCNPKRIPNINAQSGVLCHSGRIDDADWSKIAPLDEELVEKMRPYEAVYLEMMDRMEDKGRMISYAKRKRSYLRHLRYWNHLIEDKGIELFISDCLPHRIRTYILYAICKVKKIPALYFHHTSCIPAMLYLSPDWEKPAIGLRERYEELKSNPPSDEFTLSRPIEDYYKSQVEKDIESKPWFVEKGKATPIRDWVMMVVTIIRRSFRLFLGRVRTYIIKRCSFEFWMRFFTDRARVKNARKMFQFYDENASAPDLSKKYIYLPLQLQPECTTCPMGGAYNDQILMAEMLCSLLPEDMLLYVKEHPNQERVFPHGDGRDISLYKNLIAMPKVRLMPRTFDTFRLSENSIAVATATGTAGFEGLFRGKPFLMFGHDYYQYAPGVFMIRSVEDCRSALNEVLNGAKPDIKDLRLFLKALDDVSVEGYLGRDIRKVSDLSTDECAENAGGMLERRMREVLRP